MVIDSFVFFVVSVFVIIQGVRTKLCKLKLANPNMRFRLEQNSCTKECLCTSNAEEVGLEAPESFFVEIDAYEDAYGCQPAPEEIVYEETDKGMKPGATRLFN